MTREFPPYYPDLCKLQSSLEEEYRKWKPETTDDFVLRTNDFKKFAKHIVNVVKEKAVNNEEIQSRLTRISLSDSTLELILKDNYFFPEEGLDPRREQTLDVLCVYIGYKSWSDFINRPKLKKQKTPNSIKTKLFGDLSNWLKQLLLAKKNPKRSITYLRRYYQCVDCLTSLKVNFEYDSIYDTSIDTRRHYAIYEFQPTQVVFITATHAIVTIHMLRLYWTSNSNICPNIPEVTVLELQFNNGIWQISKEAKSYIQEKHVIHGIYSYLEPYIPAVVKFEKNKVIWVSDKKGGTTKLKPSLFSNNLTIFLDKNGL